MVYIPALLIAILLMQGYLQFPQNPSQTRNHKNEQVTIGARTKYCQDKAI
jgi:hypothetical protein